MNADFHSRQSPRFSRRWWVDSTKTFLWVAVVTLLVWIYADLYFTDSRDISAVLRIRCNQENLVLTSPQNVPLTIRVKGNRYAIDSFVDRLGRSSGLSVYEAGRLGKGTHVKNVTDILDNMSDFRGSGLQIILAQPEDVEIKIDELRSISVPVKLSSSGGDLAGTPSLVPDHITVRAPAGALKDLDPAKLVIYTQNLDLRNEPTDKDITRQLSLEQPDNIPGAQLSDKAVAVTFRLQKEAPARKDFTVNIQVQSPRSWEEDDTWSRYKLEIKNPLEWTNRPVTVVGPRSELDKLRPQDLNAFILLKEDDKSKVESWLPGQVQVTLPPGLDVRLAEPLAPVEYKLIKRPEK